MGVKIRGNCGSFTLSWGRGPGWGERFLQSPFRSSVRQTASVPSREKRSVQNAKSGKSRRFISKSPQPLGQSVEVLAAHPVQPNMLVVDASGRHDSSPNAAVNGAAEQQRESNQQRPALIVQDTRDDQPGAGQDHAPGRGDGPRPSGSVPFTKADRN